MLKQGKIFWFASDAVTPESVPRGVIDVSIGQGGEQHRSLAGMQQVVFGEHSWLLVCYCNLVPSHWGWPWLGPMASILRPPPPPVVSFPNLTP